MRRRFAGAYGRGEHKHRELAHALGVDAEAGPELDAGPPHARFSLAATGPPGETVDGITCLIDGNIHNAAALAAQLDLGVATPEQIVATAYRRWGEDALPRLRGDFAIALWDERSMTGLLVRDQIGSRGLFLHDDGTRLLFASDVRELIALMPRRPGPDDAGVVHWIAVGALPGASTLYEGIRRLPPASALSLAGGSSTLTRYWTPRYNGTRRGDRDELVAELRSRLERAVDRRLASDGATGVLLSGGLDSTAVAVLAARSGSGRLRAYSGVFPDYPALDESSLIELVAREARLPATAIAAGPAGLLASALEFIDEWQLPLASWGDFWARELLDAARLDGVTVMLGGDGGDEVFATREYLVADRLRRLRALSAYRLIDRIPVDGPKPGRRGLISLLLSGAGRAALPIGAHDLLRRLRGTRSAAPAWLAPKAAHLLAEADDPWAWKRVEGPLWWSHSAHLVSANLESLGSLQNYDRRAASAGLEASHPLLDLDLLELALELPPELSFDPKLNRPLVRSALGGLLPDQVRLRPDKSRFDDLVIDALRGPDLAAIRRLLGDRDARIRAYVDPEALDSALLNGRPDQHPIGRFVWAQELWRLSTAECWLRSQSDLGFPRRMLEEGALSPRPNAVRA